MAVPARTNDDARSWDNRPAIETQSGIERYMANLDFDDEVEQYEGEYARRAMSRGIKLYEQGCAMAGNDPSAQKIVAIHLQAFTENQLARAQRRQQQ